MRHWELFSIETEPPGDGDRGGESFSLGDHDADLMAFVVVMDRRLGLLRYAAVPFQARGTLVSAVLPVVTARVARTLYDEQARTLAEAAANRAYEEVADAWQSAEVHHPRTAPGVRTPAGRGDVEEEGREDRERRQDEGRPAPDGEEGGPDAEGPRPAVGEDREGSLRPRPGHPYYGDRFNDLGRS